MGDPSSPEEVGRWWLPGTREGDDVPPPQRHPHADAGFRVHNINVYPERGERAYLGYIDGGVIILDISDMSSPTLVSRLDYHPPLPGFTHTVLPLFERDLLIVTDEAVTEDCSDWPKLTWVVDARGETNLVPIATMPMPSREEYCGRPGRFGAHNIHENQLVPTSWTSDEIIVGAYFNTGVRVHDISDPLQARGDRLLRPGAGQRRRRSHQRRLCGREPRYLRHRPGGGWPLCPWNGALALSPLTVAVEPGPGALRYDALVRIPTGCWIGRLPVRERLRTAPCGLGVARGR